VKVIVVRPTTTATLPYRRISVSWGQRSIASKTTAPHSVKEGTARMHLAAADLDDDEVLGEEYLQRRGVPRQQRREELLVGTQHRIGRLEIRRPLAGHMGHERTERVGDPRGCPGR